MRAEDMGLRSVDIQFNGLSTFVWRTEQAVENERAHGLDICGAACALEDPLVFVTELDCLGRCEAIGLSAGRLITVRYEMEDERIRILSAWPAIPTEEALYGR